MSSRRLDNPFDEKVRPGRDYRMDSQTNTMSQTMTMSQTNTMFESGADSGKTKEAGTIIERETPPALVQTSQLRKLLLLSMFTLAEFLDAFNNSALFPAIPIISEELSFLPAETGWLISAYQLTFAAFLLVSGRISDVYTPKPAFIAGALILGLTHLGGGFVRQKIALLVLRALGGIGGALTIPSALSMIVQLFPDPASQAKAIALFGSAGAIGNILGLLIGAIFVQYASWPWIFWFTAIVGVSIAVVTFFLIPTSKETRKNVSFDAIGLSILTSAVILFIFAVTSGSTKGWSSAYVLSPLIISIAVGAVFFVWESRIDPADAVLPPLMWQLPNFAVIVGIALVPYLWFVGIFVLLTEWWQTIFGWSAIDAAVHFLPLGITAFILSAITGRLPNYFSHKWIIFTGALLAFVGTILLPFATSPDRYWPIVFPGFIIGTAGTMILFSNTSIAIFAYTPPSVAGTVGAIFNSALQLGSAVGLAALVSIQTSVDAKGHSDPLSFKNDLDTVSQSEWTAAYKGRSSAFWFIVATLALCGLSIVAFFSPTPPAPPAEESMIPTLTSVDP